MGRQGHAETADPSAYRTEDIRIIERAIEK